MYFMCIILVLLFGFELRCLSASDATHLPKSGKLTSARIWDAVVESGAHQPINYFHKYLFHFTIM